jgi:hypothetical protein
VPGNLPETAVSIGADGIVHRADGSPVREEYVLTDGSVEPEGHPVARDRALGLTVYRTEGVLVSTTTIDGTYDDQWSGPEVTYRRVRCRGGTLTVTLESDPGLFQEPQQVTAETGARHSGHPAMKASFVTLRPTERGSLTIRLVPERGVCTVRFTVRPTKVPGHGDDRELGIHFRAFEYRAQ